MQNTSFVLALALILGCVSAINFIESSWKIQPKLVVSNGTNDATFLNSKRYVLISSSANSTLSLLNEQTDTTLNQRIFNPKDLEATGKDSVVAMNLPNTNSKVGAVIADYTLAVDIIGTQPQQIRLSVLSYNGGAATQYIVTKNLDNSTNFTLYKAFAHRNRYYVIYSDSKSNYSISGVDANGANINTVVLTTNAAVGSNVDCVGLSGKDSAYCLFAYQNNTVQSLFEAIVGLKGDNNKAPDAKAFDVNATAVPPFWVAYNAGKQYGGYYLSDGNWFFKNNKNAAVTSLNHTSSPDNFLIPQVSFAFNDDIVLFWILVDRKTENNSTYFAQHISIDGKLSAADLVSGVQKVAFTQYKDGSVYAAPGNSSDIYLGQVWGSTNMFASTLQSVFAIVLAAVATLFLF